MTYCVGMLVDEGLAMIADTRTNAGVDNVSSYKKLHLVDRPGDRVLAVATAGNLSLTQTALTLVQEGIELPSEDHAETLETAGSMFRCAQLLGHALREVRKEMAPSLQADSLNASASMLLGGQIEGGEMKLYLIYSQGNFIECGRDTPYLQIGELKYGKPILDRILQPQTTLDTAALCALVSMDSTMRSNLTVGPPIEIMMCQTDSFVLQHNRFDEDDEYLRELKRSWDARIAEAFLQLPAVTWPLQMNDGYVQN